MKPVIRNLIVSLFAGTAVLGAQPAGAVGVSIQNTTSPHWTGYWIQSSDTNDTSFDSSYGLFTVPTVNCPAKPLWQMSMWSGLGGVPTKGLFQSGVSIQCNKGHVAYGAFWEYVATSKGSIAHQIFDQSQYPVEPGDTISAYVNLADGAANFQVRDYNYRGAEKWVANASAEGFSEMGSPTAECILERTGANPYYPMINFRTASFTDQVFHSVPCGATVTSNPDFGYVLYTAPGAQLPPSSDVFNVKMVSDTTGYALAASSLPDRNGNFRVKFITNR